MDKEWYLPIHIKYADRYTALCIYIVDKDFRENLSEMHIPCTGNTRRGITQTTTGIVCPSKSSTVAG